MMQTKIRYLPALMLASLGLSVPFAAHAGNTPDVVDFAQPGASSQPPVVQPKAASTAHKRSTVHHPSAAPRNPLAVDAGIAVRDTPVKEIDLPGVMHLPGDKIDAIDPSKEQKISWVNGGSKTVYLSVTEPNRIELPFKNPYIVRMSDVAVDHRSDSNNLYVYWKVDNVKDAQPRQIFIEPPGGGGQSLGLEIVPKLMPAQTVIVTDDTGVTAGHRPKSGDSGDYITHIQDLMAAVALGQSPNGFSQVDVQLPPIAMDGLVVNADTRYSGHEGDMWVYTVRNPGAGPARIQEQEFDGANVLAVSIFPKPLLQPGEKTQVYVLARKREEQ